jgi:hypothetical protein
LTNNPVDDGYIVVFINDISYRAHRFIYEAFKGRLIEEGLQVHHKDANKQNKSISNLKALTPEAHIVKTRQANPQMSVKVRVTMRKAIVGIHQLTGEKRSFSFGCLAARELGFNQSKISRHLIHDQCSHVRQ